MFLLLLDKVIKDINKKHKYEIGYWKIQKGKYIKCDKLQKIPNMIINGSEKKHLISINGKEIKQVKNVST